MADTSSVGVCAEVGKMLDSKHTRPLRDGVALVLREVMQMARVTGPVLWSI